MGRRSKMILFTITTSWESRFIHWYTSSLLKLATLWIWILIWSWFIVFISHFEFIFSIFISVILCLRNLTHLWSLILWFLITTTLSWFNRWLLIQILVFDILDINWLVLILIFTKLWFTFLSANLLFGTSWFTFGLLCTGCWLFWFFNVNILVHYLLFTTFAYCLIFLLILLFSHLILMVNFWSIVIRCWCTIRILHSICTLLYSSYLTIFLNGFILLRYVDRILDATICGTKVSTCTNTAISTALVSILWSLIRILMKHFLTSVLAVVYVW